MKRLDGHRTEPRVGFLLGAVLLGLAMPTQAQFFTSSGSVFTTPTNVPVPPAASTFDYLGNTLVIGQGAPGSFASIAGATMTGGGLTIGAGGVGSGSATLSGAGNVTQLRGAQTRLDVGQWGTGSLIVAAGAVLDAAVANAACGVTVFCGSFVGNSAGSTGTLTVTGLGSEVRALQYFAVGLAEVYTTAVHGFNSGTPGGTTNGSVNVLAGATLRTERADVGAGPGSPAALGTERGIGTVVVDGPTSSWRVGPNTVDNTAAGVVVGNRTGGQGSIDIRNGGLLLIDGSTGSGPNDFLNIGQNGGTGSVTVRGVGSTLEVRGNSPIINVGRSGSGAESSFNVLAGGTAQSLFMSVGRDATSGRLLIDGAGSQLNLVGVGTGAAFLNVGTNGTGVATVSNGGRVFISDGGQDSRSGTGSPGMSIGRDAGGTGLLTITGPGSAITIVGNSVSPAAGDADNFNPFVGIGRNPGSSGALVIENGGQLTLQGNAISTVANSRGTTVTIGGENNTPPGGRGTALVTGTGSLLAVTGVDAFIGVGLGAASFGELAIANGGTVTATNVGVGRGGGTGTLVMDGGALLLSGQQTGNFLSGASLSIGQAGGSGSAVIGNASTVTITNSGSAGASLNVGGSGAFPLGTGSLVVSNGSSVEIYAGSLGSFTVGRDGTGTASIALGSGVDVGAGSTYIGRLASGNGSLTLEGGSFLTSAYVGVGATTAGDGGTGRLIVSNSAVNATTIEVGTNGYIGGDGGTLNGDVILHGTLSPGDSPGSVIINGRFRTGSGHLILDVASNGLGGYITDRVLFTLGTLFSFNGIEVTFNFLGADPLAFAASGGFDLDTFLRSLDPVTGETRGLSSVFAANETWETLFATATFNAVADGRPLPELSILPDGTFTVAAIPEPETWALMGIGLGCLGWVARRRRPQPLAA